MNFEDAINSSSGLGHRTWCRNARHGDSSRRSQPYDFFQSDRNSNGTAWRFAARPIRLRSLGLVAAVEIMTRAARATSSHAPPSSRRPATKLPIPLLTSVALSRIKSSWWQRPKITMGRTDCSPCGPHVLLPTVIAPAYGLSNTPMSPGLRSILSTSPRCCSSAKMSRPAYSSRKTERPSTSVSSSV